MNQRVSEDDILHSSSLGDCAPDELETKFSTQSATPMFGGLTSLVQALLTEVSTALASGAPLRRALDGLIQLRTQLDSATAPGTELRAKIDALPRLFERAQKLPPQLQAALNAANFPPCHRLNTKEILEIADTYTARGSEASTLLIETQARTAFGDEPYRTQMLADWEANPKLHKRMTILRMAAAAVVEGRFELAIPALLAQLEGLVADLFDHAGQMSGKKYQEYIRTLQQPDSLFSSVLEAFFQRTLLTSFAHGQSIGSNMSRHAILHGADTSYGTELNAIKAIWMIDYVQAMLGPVEST